MSSDACHSLKDGACGRCMRIQLAISPHHPRIGCANLSAHMNGMALTKITGC